MFTDSHTHLYLETFSSDLNTVITNAVHNNVNRFLLPNIDVDTLPKLLSICKQNKDLLFPMIGLHPCSVSKNYFKDLQKLEEYIGQKSFIGIGEVGIDLYWEDKFIKEQKEAFRIQINWAKKYDLPLIIHCRNSFNEIYSILKSEKTDNITGIFHCFSGTHEEALKIIGMGFYLGIGGVLTFKNTTLPEVIKKIDLQNLVLETDSPYLAPHPMRGKRNEPKFLPLIAEKIAKIHNTKIEKVAKITNQNINTIFFSK